MPAWPGGPCPQCGDDMPENLIHCQSCRTLLNSELKADSVEIPAFIPLQEIEAMVDLAPNGNYVLCGSCNKELRVHNKYIGQRVQCKFCTSPFVYDEAIEVTAMYGKCPHCTEEIRAALKYSGMKVACRHCDGKIQL
ncbi:MAG: hypothetical protein AB8G99_20585 [Planctomycetaceae bacterium]